MRIRLRIYIYEGYMCICQILPWATFHKCKFKEGSDSKENIGTLPVAVFAPSKVFEENSEEKNI